MKLIFKTSLLLLAFPLWAETIPLSDKSNTPSSVYVNKIEGPGLVAIHDGVRPLVSEDIIGASFHLAAVHQSAVAAVRLKDSIRMTDQDNTKAVDRSRFRLIQTPQTFDIDLIKKAYEMNSENDGCTSWERDASPWYSRAWYHPRDTAN